MEDKVFSQDEINKRFEKFEKKSNIEKLRNISHLKNIPPLSFSEILEITPDPRKNILHPILPEQGWTFIYAESGLGKTLFTLNLAYCIASGGSFLKYKSPNPKKVLYVDGEMSYRSMHERLMGIVKEQKSLEFPDNFYLYTPDKMLPPNSPAGAIPEPLPKICSQQGQEFYNYIIQQYNIDVIILDNLSVLSTHDENSAEEWYVIQDWFTHLKAIGKSLILVHHAGKNGQYRGTSRMIDTADTAISLESVEQSHSDNETNHIKRFNVKYKKHRNFDGQEAQTYEVTLQNCMWSYQAIEITLMDRLIDCVSAKMTQKDIAFELGITQSTVSKMIKKAKSSGRIPE